jgi:acyl carrier protein
VLKTEGIDATTHFIDLGGDSLAAGRISARIRKAFGVELSPVTLFFKPTVRELAEAIEAEMSTDSRHA